MVLLEGEDAHANEYMVKQRSLTDEILYHGLEVWPEGLEVDGVPLTTRQDLGDMLNTACNLSHTGNVILPVIRRHHLSDVVTCD